MNEMDKYYQTLGLNPRSSEKEIVEAYKVLIKVWHPDRFLSDPSMGKIANEKMKEIDEAYKKILIFIDGNYEQKKKIPETRSEVKNEVRNIIVELKTAFKVDSRPSHLQKEGPTDGQSVKLPHGGLGVGAKIGLTVMVVLISGVIYGLFRDIGHGQYFWTAIVVGILFYIWSRPNKKANK